MDLDRYFAEHPMGESVSSDPRSIPDDFKSGFVALVGRPNAGKSTLLNAVMGEKLAITSHTAQTTRNRLRAILTDDDRQIILVDTPGLHKPHDMLGEELNASALKSLEDVDVVVMVIDASQPIGGGDEWVAVQVRACSARKICVLSKRDLVDDETLHGQAARASELMSWDAMVGLSAKRDHNVDAFLEEVVELLPPGPPWFPSDMQTDQPIESMVAEFIREKVFRDFKEEIPHSVGVQVDEMEFVPKKDLYRIFASIYVERESQKAIIVGKGGRSIKRIGSRAREDLEHLLGARVFLDLKVKVKKHWRSDESQLRRFGYMD